MVSICNRHNDHFLYLTLVVVVALANEAMDMKKSWCSIVARAADDEHVLEKADV